ncbi:MAG: hypothetical protein HY901_36790 [Deltaproteobacteria bacterium]|nr:hypothetical protein [Deltaproteobacteria bacterium]
MKLGLVADSQGDLDALEGACELLIERHGASRVLFLGGRWSDFDDLVQRKREQARGGAEYGDADFLADVAAFVAKAAAAELGGVAHRLKKDAVEAFSSRFARVPDKDSLHYRDPNVPRTLPDMVGDRIAILVHDKADLTREEIEPATFLFHGNSPAPAVVQIGTRFFVTPGRLTGAAERTCGLLVQEEKSWEFVSLGLDGRELRRVPLALQTRSKLTVR